LARGSLESPSARRRLAAQYKEPTGNARILAAIERRVDLTIVNTGPPRLDWLRLRREQRVRLAAKTSRLTLPTDRPGP
jgi:hypothetical protein